MEPSNNGLVGATEIGVENREGIVAIRYDNREVISIN